MFTRHAFLGRPLMRNRTGSGLRHPSLIVAARDASTGIYGFPFLILMVAVNTVLTGIEQRAGATNLRPEQVDCESQHARTEYGEATEIGAACGVRIRSGNSPCSPPVEVGSRDDDRQFQQRSCCRVPP